MFDRLKRSKLFFWSLEVLIIATLVLVLTKINFLFKPVGTFFSTLFTPVLVAGFLFYVFNPIVSFLTDRLKIKRIFSIVIVLLLILLTIIFTVVSIIPNLVTQMTQLAENIPSFANNVEQWLYKVADNDVFKQVDIVAEFEKLNISYGTIIQRSLSGISNSLGSIFGTIISATMTIFTAPFILFYMLKDGHKLADNVARVAPERRRSQVIELLGQLNKTLSNYISGQVIECLFVATFTFLGYWLVGVDYAFLFGVIAGITNLIPYLGPYLGLLPAVCVTIFNDPFKALLCCIVVLIVQQLDGNIIYPNVIGKSLAIHPLTIILVLLVAGNLAGLLGIFLGVPFYAVCRTIVMFVVNLVRDDRTKRKQQELTQ